MKIGYKRGKADGMEEGYALCLRDCEDQMRRSLEEGARLAYIAVLERMKSCSTALDLVGVMGEIENALRQ